ncbi:hypothetical protein [Iodobacter sp.]|uniref:hypothetical protein n=1 Tax=Iodobacter sp. TaxID=1915058 RepID=UPI0025F49A11|nr:hypothetical protein [Iodobacter sp.]
MAMSSRFAGAVLSYLFLCCSAFAADNVSRPTRGTIESVNGNSVQIITRQGGKLDVKLTNQSKINSITKAKISDIKANSFIGTAAAPQADGTLKALEVHVFSPSLRGNGEGFNPFESADGKINTMTNGTVGKLVNNNGRTLTIKFNNAEKTVIIPDDVPVVLITPSDRSVLMPGVKVILFFMKDDKGQSVIRAISAGKDGITPPM